MHLLIGANVYFINTRKARLQLIDCWLKQLLKSFLQTNIWKTPEEIVGIIIFSIWIDFLIPYNYSRKQRECVESVKNPRKTQLFSTLEISKTDSLILLCCCLWLVLLVSVTGLIKLLRADHAVFCWCCSVVGLHRRRPVDTSLWCQLTQVRIYGFGTMSRSLHTSVSTRRRRKLALFNQQKLPYFRNIMEGKRSIDLKLNTQSLTPLIAEN